MTHGSASGWHFVEGRTASASTAEERLVAAEPALGRTAVAGLAAAVAVVHGLLWWLSLHPVARVLWGDESRYLTAARDLLAGHPDWQPGRLWPPLYPRFLAGVLALSGGSLAGVQLVQTVLLAVAAAVLLDLVRRLTGSSTAAAVAAALTLGYPPLVGFAHFLWPEVLHLTLLLGLLWALVARPHSVVWAAVAGLSLGLALLTKSLLLPFAPVLVVAAAVGPGPRVRLQAAAAGRAAVLVVVAALTVMPTVLGNYRRDGLLSISDSSAFNLWVGLNEVSHRPFADDVAFTAYRQFVGSASTFTERNRILHERIRQRFRERSLLDITRGQLARQYFLLLDKDSYLTEQLPGGAAARQGSGYLGAGPAVAAVVRGLCYGSYGLLLVAAPVGLAAWRFRERRWIRVLLLFVAYNLALFFWLHPTTRYQVQLLPVLFLGASCAAAWLRRGPEAPVRRLGRSGWAACAALVGLLVFLAFGGPFV